MSSLQINLNFFFWWRFKLDYLFSFLTFCKQPELKVAEIRVLYNTRKRESFRMLQETRDNRKRDDGPPVHFSKNTSATKEKKSEVTLFFHFFVYLFLISSF